MTELRQETPAGRLARMAAVALFAAIVAFAGTFTMPPLDRDESRFAQATAQMLETGDFISIRFQERERNKKPAGIHWLQAASVATFSDVEAREIWAYRLPSSIGAIIAAIFTYIAGARLYGPATGLMAGLLLASAPLFAAEASIAKTDGVLLATVTVAMTALLHVYARFEDAKPKTWMWPVAFWIALGAGVLVKGPIAPMVAGLTGAALFLRRRRFGWIAALRPVTGLILLVLMVAPWTIAIGEATDGRFFAEALGHDMLGKLGEAQESHVGPPGYHLAFVWILFWPAAALLLPGFARALRTRAAWPSYFLLAWIVPSWLVFEFTATKLPHYPLPLYPALAILAARAAASGEASRRVLWRKLGAASYFATGLIVSLLIAIAPVVLGEGPLTPLCLAASLLVAGGSLAVAALFWTGRALPGAFAATAVGGLLAWTLLGAALPSLDRLAISPRLSAALDEAGLHPLRDGAPPAAVAGYYEPSAVFLLGTKTKMTGGGGAARHLIENPGAAVAVEARLQSEFEESLKSAGAAARPLAVIDGLNYSNGRRIRLTVYAAPE